MIFAKMQVTLPFFSFCTLALAATCNNYHGVNLAWDNFWSARDGYCNNRPGPYAFNNGKRIYITGPGAQSHCWVILLYKYFDSCMKFN
jgi:hypothetical protein